MRRLNQFTAAVILLTASMIFTSCTEEEVSAEVKSLRQSQAEKEKVEAEEDRLTLEEKRDVLTTLDSIADISDLENARQDLVARLNAIKREEVDAIILDFGAWRDAVVTLNATVEKIDGIEEDIALKQDTVSKVVNDGFGTFKYTGVEVAQSNGEDIDEEGCTFCIDYRKSPDADVDSLEFLELQKSNNSAISVFNLFITRGPAEMARL